MDKVRSPVAAVHKGSGSPSSRAILLTSSQSGTSGGRRGLSCFCFGGVVVGTGRSSSRSLSCGIVGNSGMRIGGSGMSRSSSVTGGSLRLGGGGRKGVGRVLLSLLRCSPVVGSSRRLGIGCLRFLSSLCLACSLAVRTNCSYSPRAVDSRWSIFLDLSRRVTRFLNSCKAKSRGSASRGSR